MTDPVTEQALERARLKLASAIAPGCACEACSDARALLALADENERLKKDKERLDFLDRLNAALNQHYGTTYRWKLVTNHNVNRLFVGALAIDLHDSEAHGHHSCRNAIDEVIGGQPLRSGE